MADRENRKIRLRRCVAPENELYKKPYFARNTVLDIAPVVYKEGTSIINPHIIIKTVENLVTYNYLYCYDFERYYFIDDMIMLPQGQVELVCRVDPFYTFKSAIENLTVHEERATEGESNLIVDEEVPVMHNAILSEVIGMNMLTPLKPPSMQFVATMLTSNQFTRSDLTPHNIGVIYAGFSDDAYDLAVAIAQRAWDYLKDYNAFKETVIDYNKKGKYDEVFPKTYVYTREQTEEFATSFWLNDDRTSYGFFSRRDTLYPSEDGSGLRYISVGNYPSDTPSKISNAGGVWNCWDCSQFAWRCCRFNSKYPMNIAGGTDTTVAPNDDTYGDTTGGIAEFLANSTIDSWDIEHEDGTWETMTNPTCQVTNIIESKDDLCAGDIIISGSVSSHSRYLVYCVGYLIDGQMQYLWKKSGSYTKNIGNELFKQLMDDNPNAYNIFYMIYVNHARVYIGDGDYIDSCNANTQISEKYGQKAGNSVQSTDVFSNVLGERSITSFSSTIEHPTSGNVGLLAPYSKGTNDMPVVTINGKACLVFRPALLLNANKHIPYTEWSNRQGVDLV